MNRILRSAAALALACGLLGSYAPAALAAAPGNDVSSGATVVSLGFSETLDTTQATTDADDAQLNSTCGAPATDASVWYRLEGSDQGVIVDVWSSDYSAGVLVGVGTPGSLEIVTCGPGAVTFFAASGSTYYILAIDDQLDGAGNGGQLTIGFSATPPPPTVEITVDRYGKVSPRTGVATISGTYTCTNGDFFEVYGDARQDAGRFTVSGSFGFVEYGTCDGATRTWSASVVPQGGKFAGGKALTVSFAYSCGLFECRDTYAEQTVILQGKK
jgi:hypothetical protein